MKYTIGQPESNTRTIRVHNPDWTMQDVSVPLSYPLSFEGVDVGFFLHRPHLDERHNAEWQISVTSGHRVVVFAKTKKDACDQLLDFLQSPGALEYLKEKLSAIGVKL